MTNISTGTYVCAFGLTASIYIVIVIGQYIGKHTVIRLRLRRTQTK